MMGIIVSGRAVPIAARTDPTAPSARSSFRPNHSMPFVNSSAPSRMTRNASARTTTSIAQALKVSELMTPTAMTTRIPIETASMSRSDSRA